MKKAWPNWLVLSIWCCILFLSAPHPLREKSDFKVMYRLLSFSRSDWFWQPQRFGHTFCAGSRQAALLSPLETLLAVLWAVLLGESLTLVQWMGTLFVIASAALGARATSNRVRAKATNAFEVQPNPT